MAKRFTDTEKWEDPWFRGLSPSYQRFWIYILDKCDQAGVWEVDFELVEFFLKERFEMVESLEILKERVVVFNEGKKWGIPKFIRFQYGNLSLNSKPHRYVLALLSSYEKIGYPKGIHTLKDQDQDKDKDNRVGSWVKNVPKNDTLLKMDQWKKERENAEISEQ